MNAGLVVKLYLAAIILITALLLLADAALWWRGEPTVSEWLRHHRHWYDYVLATAMGINAVLFVHLFGRR